MNTENLENEELNIITQFGLSVIHYSTFILKLILTPLLLFGQTFKSFFSEIKNYFKKWSVDFSIEKDEFIDDYKLAKAKYRQNKKSDITEYKSSAFFTKEVFKNHKQFLKKLFNIIFPVLTSVIFIIVINIYSGLDFALKVIYNDTDIGYIENEKVFRDAEEIIKERLILGGQSYSTNIVSEPEYKISVIHPNELTDSNGICEKIIDNSDSGLITACGVYVDGKFLCSVKNESDASLVFKNILDSYCKENKIDINNSKYIIDIIEDISYIQGLYSENTIMSSENIEELIQSKNKSEGTTYTFKENDTQSSVMKKFNLSSDQFYALNPSLKKDKEIETGKKINVIKSIPFINISVSETRVTEKEIKYKTEEIKTNSLYQGRTKTVTEGKNGKKEVTNLITYINGVKTSEKEIKSVVTQEPVNEKVYIGTRPVPTTSELNGVASGTFIWPAIGINTVTSEFGYRILYEELNFHRGLDISGAGALGKPIVASAAGTVELVTAGTTGYGYSVLIDHGNGVKTRYAHCLADSIIVNVGDKVEQGQKIAQVGSTGNSTGPHVHFEIIYNGAYANPLDYLTR